MGTTERDQAIRHNAILNTAFVPCSQCGAALMSLTGTELHREWHKRLDDAIKGLMDWRKESLVSDEYDSHSSLDRDHQFIGSGRDKTGYYVQCRCGFETTHQKTHGLAWCSFYMHKALRAAEEEKPRG